MNTNMFENPVVQDNLKILEHYGYEVIAPACGYLACGDTGAGKMRNLRHYLPILSAKLPVRKI